MKAVFPIKLFHRLRHTHIENKGLKILSVILAILLFALSRQPMTEMRLSGVQIEFQGLRPGIEVGGDASKTVSLRLRGPRDIVRNLMAHQLSVIVDLGNKEQGERIFQLRPENVLAPDGISVLQIDPSNIKIRLDLTGRKLVSVEPQFIGRVADGREVYGVKPSLEQVEIEGPQLLLNKINKVFTETVNLTGHAEDFYTSVEVEAPDDSLRVKTKGPINLLIKIGEQRIARRFEKIPIRWPDQPPTGRLLTKTVSAELFGPQSIIEAIKPSDLWAELASSGLPSGAYKSQVQLRLPPNLTQQVQIKNIIPKEAKVKI